MAGIFFVHRRLAGVVLVLLGALGFGLDLGGYVVDLVGGLRARRREQQRHRDRAPAKRRRHPVLRALGVLVAIVAALIINDDDDRRFPPAPLSP